MKKIIVALLSIFFSGALVAQTPDCPPNIDFEAGTKAGWTCKVGSYGRIAPKTYGFNFPTVNCLNLNGNNAPLGSTAPSVNNGADRHVIMSNKTTMDPNSNGLVPVVAPGGGNYSFRLGDVSGGGDGQLLSKAEAVSFTFPVTAQNAGLTYMYAAFLAESSVSSVPHTKVEAPRFEVLITDATGKAIPCGQYLVIAQNLTSFKNGANVISSAGSIIGQWKYCDWTSVALDLSAYIGTTITIEFRVGDCYPFSGTTTTCNNGICVVDSIFNPSNGNHSAYAYIDLLCKPVQIIAPNICANQSSLQICAPDGYAGYSWPAGQPGISGSPKTKCVTITSPIPGTTYTVNLTTATGCLSAATVKLKGFDFTVKDTSVCVGSPDFPIDLKPSIPGTYNYLWTPSTGLSCTTCEDPIVSPTTTRTYTVTMSDPSVAGCSKSKPVTITVNPLPVVTVNDATICKGSGATLNATGASTYTWSGTDLNTTNGATVIASPQATTTYTVNAQSSAGCTGSAIANVTVNNCMFVKAVDTTVCIGKCARLKALASVGDPPYTYTWSGGNADGATVCPTVTTNYTVTAWDVNGNSASDILTVTIENKPTITVNPVSVCIGNCAQLKANGALTYTWSPTTGLNTNTGDTVSACNLQKDQSYLITGGTAAGCTNTYSVSVTVNIPPVVTATNDTICARSTAVINAKGALKYTWTPDFLKGSTIHVTPGASTTYTVIGEDSNGCTESTTAFVFVKLTPTADFMADPEVVSIEDPYISFYNKSTNGASYHWKLGDGTVDSTFDIVNHKFPEPGTYEVCLEVANKDCYSSVCKTVKVVPVWTFYVPDAFSPNGDGLNDGFIGVGTNILYYEMWIFDRWGNKIYHCREMDKPWNGRRENNLNNDVGPEDVYVWKIMIMDVLEKKHVFIGHVTLVR